MYKLPILVMETGVNAVTAGGNTAGWVSGNPASQAAAASVQVVFDLGPNWHQYTTLLVSMYPSGASSSYENIYFTGSDSATTTIYRRLSIYGANAIGAAFSGSLTSANGGTGFFTRPFGRYVTANFTINATNGTDANAKMALAAYPV